MPTNFILSCLGPRAKYSCALYPTGRETLAEAEVCMLETYCEKAKLADGIEILDLGCGWGSLSLFLAEVSGWSEHTCSHLTPGCRNIPMPESLHFQIQRRRRHILTRMGSKT